MAQSFPRLDILPPTQRRLWDELTEVPSEFTLYGGTAIALHLGHRQSVDFDFFGVAAFDPQRLTRAIPFLRNAQVVQVEPNTLSVIVDRDGPVKVSFFGLPWLRRIADAVVAPQIGLKIAALVDLAGTKAAVVQARAEAKDYLDIDALIVHGVDLSLVLAAGAAIHGAAFNPESTLKALTYFGDGDLLMLDEALKLRLVEAVRGVDLDHLPSVTLRGDAGSKGMVPQ